MRSGHGTGKHSAVPIMSEGRADLPGDTQHSKSCQRYVFSILLLMGIVPQ